MSVDMVQCKCGYRCSELNYNKTDGKCPACKKVNKAMETKYKEGV